MAELARRPCGLINTYRMLTLLKKKEQAQEFLHHFR
jgi:hypothetical protein